ncbi:arsenate reductase ArsC [Niveibacterium sp.]|uniref:arsenate reductase ArsC n=1 Tax=Niveibacterium sp. TaxID=2017444 RepID=UPI0035AEB56B
MSDKSYNVLFICTGNSARSIIAEAVLNKLGDGRFHAFSAGSHPRGSVHPMTLRVLAEQGYETAALRSKGWDEFAGPGAPTMDFIFTVCDKAAGEGCPAWPGQPITAHWGFADPAAVEGDDAQQHRAFAQVEFEIATRLRHLMSLPIASLDRLSLQNELRALGVARG